MARILGGSGGEGTTVSSLSWKINYSYELLWVCACQFLCQDTDNQTVLETKGLTHQGIRYQVMFLKPMFII